MREGTGEETPKGGPETGRSVEDYEALLERERTARRNAEESSRALEEQAALLKAQAAELETQAASLRALNDELAASRARLQAMMDSSLDAIIAIDASSKILDWNGHAESLFGWPAEEAEGRLLTETIIPPQHREAHSRGIAHYRRTGEGPILNRRIEITALHRDGREFPVELTVAAGSGGAHATFTAFIRDLSESKRNQRQEAARYDVTRILAESHTLEEASPRLLEAMGTKLGWDVGSFWVPDRESGELRSLALWHEPGVRVPRFAAHTREITFAPGIGLPGRVWADREPAWIEDVEREENFPRAAAAVREGLHGAFGFPILSGREVLGVIEFFDHEVQEPDQALLQTVEAIGRDIAQSIKRVRAEEKAERMRAELERVNEHLQRANEDLEARSREAEAASHAKSDFLAAMSHELRTPLNAITGYTSLLKLEVAGPITEGQEEQLNRVEASSAHLIHLIDEILDLAKVESGQSEVRAQRVRVGDVLDAAASLILPQAGEKDLEIVDECGDRKDVVIVGDRDRIRQILANLLSNAVKFTEADGRITLRCDVAGQGGDNSAQEGEPPWLYIEVEDTGIGIAADKLELIFEPFRQAEGGTTRSWGGTGLGLAIARRFARLMGGDVRVRSEVGRGSCFSLCMPVDSAPESGGGR